MTCRPLAIALLAAAACKGDKPRKQPPPASPPAVAVADASTVDVATDAAPRATRTEHTVWRLVDQRHLAHRRVDDEIVLDARAVDLARFTRFGMPAPRWHLGAQVGGERGALMDRQASLAILLGPEQLTATQLTVRVFAAAPKQVLELRVNGVPIAKRGRVPLEPGWQTIAFPIAAGTLVAGSNVLAFETLGPVPKDKAKVGVSWVRLGTPHPDAAIDPLALAAFDPAGDAIEVAPHAAVGWYVMLPEGAHLVADVPAPCQVEVSARGTDGMAGGLLASDQDRVDLSALAGKTAFLQLRARECDRARVIHPHITVFGPEPARLPAAPPPELVVVWVVPDLRGDPAFDELARASVVFLQFAWVDDLGGLAKGLAMGAQGRQTVVLKEASAESITAQLGKLQGSPATLVVASTANDPAPLAAVMGHLKTAGAWDRTLLLVTTAQGRELVVHDPARFPAGTIVDEGIDGLDIVPTVFDALGAPPPTGTQGASVIPLAQGSGRGWPRPSYAPLGGDVHTMRIGRWQLTVGTTGLPALVDGVADPQGKVDLALLRPLEAALLSDALGLFLALRTEWKKAEWGVVTTMSGACAKALDEAASP